MYSIYKHTFKNGKSYIGLTSYSMEQRLEVHKKEAQAGSPFLFHKALRKYDFDIESEVLDICETLDEANILEQKYIEKFDTFKNGYNMTIGGDTPFTSVKGKTYKDIYCSKYGEEEGLKKIEEMLKKKSQKLKGREISKENREKLSKNHKGKVVVIDIETGKCFKISSEEFHSNPNYVSPSLGFVNVINIETGEKLKVSCEEFHSNEKYQSVMSGVKLSEETKKKMSETRKGRKHSEETKKRISDALKRRNSSENIIETYRNKETNELITIREKSTENLDKNIFLKVSRSYKNPANVLTPNEIAKKIIPGLTKLNETNKYFSFDYWVYEKGKSIEETYKIISELRKNALKKFFEPLKNISYFKKFNKGNFKENYAIIFNKLISGNVSEIKKILELTRKPLISKEYYYFRGFTNEIEIEKRIQKIQKERSPRCVEYYLCRGNSLEEAKEIIRQRSFEFNKIKQEKRRLENENKINSIDW